MGKKAVALALVLMILIFPLAIAHPTVFLVKAQTTSDFHVNIASPINGSTYNTSLLIIKLQTSTGMGSNADLDLAPVLMNYSLDGILNGSIPYNVTRSGLSPPFAIQWDDGLTTIQVSQGNHILKIITGVNGIPLNTTNIFFTVDIGESPSPSPSPTQEPSPTPNTQGNLTPILIIVSILVVVVVVALVVYFVKHRGVK